MNLYEADRMAHSLIAQHLPGQGWRVKWDNAKSRAGQCNYSTRTLHFSVPVFKVKTEQSARETILHEIAHAMTPGANHGPEWVRVCRAIGGSGERVDRSITREQQASMALYRIECAVTRKLLGTANRKGKRLARSVCNCHRQAPLWITQR